MEPFDVGRIWWSIKGVETEAIFVVFQCEKAEKQKRAEGARVE